MASANWLSALAALTSALMRTIESVIENSVEMIRAGAEVEKNIKHAIRHLMSASQ
jgi:uncharacterized membrane protein